MKKILFTALILKGIILMAQNHQDVYEKMTENYGNEYDVSQYATLLPQAISYYSEKENYPGLIWIVDSKQYQEVDTAIFRVDGNADNYFDVKINCAPVNLNEELQQGYLIWTKDGISFHSHLTYLGDYSFFYVSGYTKISEQQVEYFCLK